MTTNDDKSYRSFLNKLAFEYNNTYHHSINKNPINVVYSSLTEKRPILQLLSLSVMIESELLSVS